MILNNVFKIDTIRQTDIHMFEPYFFIQTEFVYFGSITCDFTTKTQSEIISYSFLIIRKSDSLTVKKPNGITIAGINQKF